MVNEDESWDSTIDHALQALLPEGEMFSRWVMVAETIGNDGQYTVTYFSAPNLLGWEALGLLDYGKIKERSNIAGSAAHEEED